MSVPVAGVNRDRGGRHHFSHRQHHHLRVQKAGCQNSHEFLMLTKLSEWRKGTHEHMGAFSANYLLLKKIARKASVQQTEMPAQSEVKACDPGIFDSSLPSGSCLRCFKLSEVDAGPATLAATKATKRLLSSARRNEALAFSKVACVSALFAWRISFFLLFSAVDDGTNAAELALFW